VSPNLGEPNHPDRNHFKPYVWPPLPKRQWIQHSCITWQCIRVFLLYNDVHHARWHVLATFSSFFGNKKFNPTRSTRWESHDCIRYLILAC
jgi:hypothetical protein